MALPATTLLISPRSEHALDVADLDYEILKRRDLGLAYIQAGGEGRRFAVTKAGHHRVQIYDTAFMLAIASLIMDAGWRIHDEVSPHAEF